MFARIWSLIERMESRVRAMSGGVPLHRTPGCVIRAVETHLRPIRVVEGVQVDGRRVDRISLHHDIS